MEDDAPDAAKNICMNNIPMDVPVVRNEEKNLGNSVADDTVSNDNIGNDDIFVVGNNNFVIIFDNTTNPDDMANDIDIDDNVIMDLLFAVSFITASSDDMKSSFSSFSSENFDLISGFDNANNKVKYKATTIFSA